MYLNIRIIMYMYKYSVCDIMYVCVIIRRDDEVMHGERHSAK